MSGILQACCCGGDGSTCERDCIWQTEIESGCCHKDDTLLLWCERPGFTVSTQGGCNVTVDEVERYDEYCCTRVQPLEDPVQAIYHYYNCFYRCIKPTILGLGGYDGLAEMCPPATCEIDPLTGIPTPCAAYLNFPSCNTPACAMSFKSGCCNDPEYNGDPWSNNCVDCCDECNDEGMSEWRRQRMACTDKWKWLVESICHKDGQDLGSGVGCGTVSYSGGSYSNCTRLGGLNRAHQMLCVVHFERWWRVAECPDGDRIYVPGCSPTVSGFDCGGNLCVASQLVPKFWIYACSGIPLYAGDLIDAIRFGVITSDEAEQFLEDLEPGCTHPDQIVLNKLAKAGYIRANDWRDEQQLAYSELNTKFPGAGYATCIEPISNMHTLGPFRKRMTYGAVGVSAQPLLRKADVVGNPDLAPLQADCFIDFPGGTQADYDYWCERQWVYFRGRPGGWTWADWNATLCPGEEDLSILLGDTRGSQNCIAALVGGCRSPFTQTACGCCNDPDEIGMPVNCRGCDDYECPLPIPDCGPPDVCETLSAKPYCEGLHFQYTIYRGDSDLRTPDGTPCNPGPYCGQCVNIKCKMRLDSYLIGAKRSRDSWLDSVPYTCRAEKPPLPVFKTWDAWSKSHVAPENAVCAFASEPAGDAGVGVGSASWCWGCGCGVPCPASEYLDRMCCGAMCPDFLCDCDPCTVDPFTGPNAPECPEHEECPPHSTEGQIDCIGYTPDCEET